MAVNYTPSKHPVNDYKATIRLAAAQVSLIESACWMSIVAVFPRPSAKVWKTKLMPSVPHTAKPDWDNIGKAVSDALNGIAYRDDSLLSRVVVEKRIAAGGEQPHTKITIGLI